jgi:hypothetical protein
LVETLELVCVLLPDDTGLRPPPLLEARLCDIAPTLRRVGGRDLHHRNSKESLTMSLFAPSLLTDHKNFWTKAGLSIAALVCAGAANAIVIDFENVDTTFAPYAPLLTGGDAVTQGGYFVNTQDVTGGIGLIGQLSLGSDPGSCLNGACPSGDSSNFLSVYNDGIVHLGLLSGAGTVFGSLSAAYIATPGNPAGSTVYLAIEADRKDGSYASFYYALSGTGSFQTISSSTVGTSLGGTGTLTSGTVTDLFVYSYFCNGSTGSCGAFKSDLGQFALDNIAMDVSPVPEPAEWALMVAGLTAIAGFARRRRSI